MVSPEYGSDRPVRIVLTCRDYVSAAAAQEIAEDIVDLFEVKSATVTDGDSRLAAEWNERTREWE